LAIKQIDQRRTKKESIEMPTQMIGWSSREKQIYRVMTNSLLQINQKMESLTENIYEKVAFLLHLQNTNNEQQIITLDFMDKSFENEVI
jgi:hypothetical protein